ncbi:MAG: putative bifunctional diguanylate cyclase/phosphodiesterase [Acidimicrobiales bacterium]|jgi:diguanylate cyclase (GGDEF)-like protein/PAS domain S-box-containing protein
MTSNTPLSVSAMPPADLILAELGEAVVVLDTDGNIVYWNGAAEHTFGWPAGDALGRDLVDLLRVEIDRDDSREVLRCVEVGKAVLDDYWVWTRDGERRPVLATITPIAEAGVLVALAIVALDVSERSFSEQRFQLGFEHGAVPTAMLGLDGRILCVNAAGCEFLGRSEPDLVGTEATSLVHPEDRDPAFVASVMAGEIERAAIERRFLRGNGAFVWGLVSLGLVRNPGGGIEYVYVQAQDITERKEAEEALVHLSLHDSLTGLPNQALLHDRLAGALARSHRYGRSVAVVFGDLDRFQLVNDNLGHRSGDLLLIEVAHRLEQTTRAADTVARFGGDEFVIICEDLDPSIRPEDLGARMTSLFQYPFRIEDQHLFATISCGVVIASVDDTAESCLRDADSAVMLAKQRGRNRVEVFNQQLRSRATRRFDLESSLQQAIERDEVRVAYQPIMDLQSRRPIAVEALLRWRQASGYVVSPNEFIPVAEESDLILRLGDFALSSALRDLVRWRSRFPHVADLSVAVNISSRQLTSRLVTSCEALLGQHGLEGAALTVEVTERGVMVDVVESIRVLEQLAQLGIKVAVDDFGTGHSSLEYLRRLPVDTLKIDRSFIKGLGSGPEDSAIVQAIIQLASALRMEVCAEGVETGTQLAELVQLGCQLGQGYFWHRPMFAPTVVRWFGSLTA